MMCCLPSHPLSPSAHHRAGPSPQPQGARRGLFFHSSEVEALLATSSWSLGFYRVRELLVICCSHTGCCVSSHPWYFTGTLFQSYGLNCTPRGIP